MKDIVIIGLLALIMCFKLFDISSDIQLGIPQWHLVQEAILLVLTAVGAIYLSYDLIRRSREVKALAKRLEYAEKKSTICRPKCAPPDRNTAKPLQTSLILGVLPRASSKSRFYCLKG